MMEELNEEKKALMEEVEEIRAQNEELKSQPVLQVAAEPEVP